jgi:hypothetical protein
MSTFSFKNTSGSGIGGQQQSFGLGQSSTGQMGTSSGIGGIFNSGSVSNQPTSAFGVNLNQPQQGGFNIVGTSTGMTTSTSNPSLTFANTGKLGTTSTSTTGGGLFNSSNPNLGQTQKGFFGTTTNIGGNVQGTQSGQFGTGGQLGISGQNIQNIQYAQNLIMSQNNKKEMDKWEIVNVIQNYLNALSPHSAGNAFKIMLYNRVPREYENQVHLFQTYRPREKAEDGTEILVDYNLWVKALQNNPNPHYFYPYQLSSPQQLVQRTKTTEVLEFSALQTIITLQNNLNDLNNKYDIDIENEVSDIKKKLHLIKMKQLSVISKSERLALITGKAEKNFANENIILTKLNNLKSLLSEKNETPTKIRELSSMILFMGFDNTAVEEKDYLKDLSKNRLENNISVLREMKKVFDDTFNSLKHNIAVINFIKNDLEHLKKYGNVSK